MFRKLLRAFWIADKLAGAAIASLCTQKVVRGIAYTTAFTALGLWWLQLPAGAWLDAGALRDRGIAAMMRFDVASGLEDLERAVELDPSNVRTRQALAGAQLWAGQYEPALASLGEAWQLEPSRHTLYVTGLVYKQMRLHDAAIGFFRECQSAESRGGLWDRESRESVSQRADTEIAECYVQLEEPRRAIELLVSAMAVPPSEAVAPLSVYAPAHFCLGVAYWLDGNQELALRQFRRAVSLNPGDSASLYNIACYYSIRGMDELALAYLERAVDTGFDQPEYFQHDPDLDNIRDSSRFSSLARQVEARDAALPRVGIRSPEESRRLVAELQGRR